MESGIFHKIDWLTFVIRGSSIQEFFDLFDFSIAPDLAAAYASSYVANAGYDTVITFNCSGFNIQVSAHDFWSVFHSDAIHDIDPSDFFNALLPKYRVDLSGSTLDALRSEGIDVDSFFRSELPLAHGEARCTRCDFAFDVINYFSSFIDDFIQGIYDYNFVDPSGLTKIYAGPQSLTYSIHLGDRKTIYMGSTGGSKMLRIYDKRFERIRSGKLIGCEYSDADCTPPESWIRLELQLRRDLAGELLYADSQDPMEIFRFIYDNYAVRQGKGHSSPILDCWASLFNWSELPPIIQNKNTVPFVPFVEKAEKYISEIAFRSIAIYVANYGWEALNALINDKLHVIQTSIIPFYRKSYTGLLRQLYSSRELNSVDLPDHFVQDKQGIFQLH